MNNIKFRGWSTEINNWIYGYYVGADAVDADFAYIIPFKDEYKEDCPTCWIVAPESVGRYVTTSNGVDVYTNGTFTASSKKYADYMNTAASLLYTVEVDKVKTLDGKLHEVFDTEAYGEIMDYQINLIKNWEENGTWDGK